jgi:hypothetical protein
LFFGRRLEIKVFDKKASVSDKGLYRYILYLPIKYTCQKAGKELSGFSMRPSRVLLELPMVMHFKNVGLNGQLASMTQIL